MFVERECRWRISRTDKHDGTSALIVSKEIINQPFSVSFALGGGTNGYVFYFVNTLSFTRHIVVVLNFANAARLIKKVPLNIKED